MKYDANKLCDACLHGNYKGCENLQCLKYRESMETNLIDNKKKTIKKIVSKNRHKKQEENRGEKNGTESDIRRILP